MLPEVREGEGFATRAPGWQSAAAARRLKGLPRDENTGKLIDPRMLRAEAIAYLSQQADLSDAAYRLAMVLLDHLIDSKLGTGLSTVSLTNPQLMQRTGWSERKVQRTFAELEEAGLVDRYTNASHRRSATNAPDLVGLFQASHGFRKTLRQRPTVKIHNPVTGDGLLRVVTLNQQFITNDSPAGGERRSAIVQNKFGIQDLSEALGCKPEARAIVEMALNVVPERDRLADVIASTARKRGWLNTLTRLSLALVWIRHGVRNTMGAAIHCLRDPNPDWRRLREAALAAVDNNSDAPKASNVVIMRFPSSGGLEYAAGGQRLIEIAKTHAPGWCTLEMANQFRVHLANKGLSDATGGDLERLWTSFVKSFAAKRGGGA